jgi:hypothetical protein
MVTGLRRDSGVVVNVRWQPHSFTSVRPNGRIGAVSGLVKYSYRSLANDIGHKWPSLDVARFGGGLDFDDEALERGGMAFVQGMVMSR